MAYEIPGFSFTLPAGADLTGKLFRGITTTSTGKVDVPSAGAGIVGVLNNKPNTNEAATVVHSGIAQVEAGATITLASGLTPLQVDSVGRVVPRTSGVVVGYALEAASASGVIIAVLIVPSLTVAASSVVGDQTAITVLTDSSGGTANNTIAAITQAANAGSADVGPVKDAIADLAAKVNTIISTLQTAGLTA